MQVPSKERGVYVRIVQVAVHASEPGSVSDGCVGDTKPRIPSEELEPGCANK